ncbi:MAG TPA: metallophosphoesterase [Aquihabitans sp.]|nr:metallophosphoesterase [Aquihabitans sp.]
MSNPGRPSISVFAVEDTTVQLTWRDLPPGPLRLTVPGTEAELALEADGGPGAAVLDGLPPGSDLRVVADQHGQRRELAVRTLDALPGDELVRVATIGDLHLGTHAFGQRGTIREVPAPEVAHPVRCAEAAVDEAAAWGATHLFAKGDLTNHGQPEEWRQYARLVAGSPLPIDAVPGNHDRAHRAHRPGLLPEEAARAFGVSVASPISVRDLPGLRVVLVDTSIGSRNLGQVAAVADDVVQAAAEAGRERAVLVALHHQLQAHLLPEGWPRGVGHRESSDLLARLGAVHPGVLVTSGHTHRHRRWDHGGATATQVGSTKDFPGVWAGYVVHEGGIRQVVRRVGRPDCLRWTDHTRRAALGAWRWVAPGTLGARCFARTWPTS